MHKLKTHSRNSLFLMELILAICFLSLTSVTCVRLFAAAFRDREKARELNHAQELLTSFGEALEGWDGAFSSLEELFPDFTPQDGRLCASYSRSWKSVSPDEAFYQVLLAPELSSTEKGGLFLLKDSSGEELSQVRIRYPRTGGEEADDEA